MLATTNLRVLSPDAVDLQRPILESVYNLQLSFQWLENLIETSRQKKMAASRSSDAIF
jgi:hypothetical protein